MNYFSLIDEIKQVSLRYGEEFYEGDIYEYLNSGNHKYPSIILTVQNITTDEDVSTISATIFAVDRLTNDSSNKLEVQSLCMSKITQILGTLEERVSNIQSNTLVPFTEKFSDLCGGMYGEFTLDYIGEGVCDLGLQIKEIELTRNGVYDIMGYDKAIVNIKLQDLTVTSNGEYISSDYDVDGFSKVTVDVEPLLQDLTVTEDGEYIPSDYGVEGFGKVTAKFDTSNLPKIKVSSFKVSNDCLNGTIWEGEKLIDTSECTILQNTIYNINITELDVSGWDVSNVNQFQSAIANCTALRKITGLENWRPGVVDYCTYFLSQINLNGYYLDLRNWDMSNTYRLDYFGYKSNIKFDLEGWDTQKVTTMSYFLSESTNTWANLVGMSAAGITVTNVYALTKSSLTTVVGGYTINEVINNDLRVFDGIKYNLFLSPNYYTRSNLTRPSLRAVINGLADLTGKTSQKLTIGNVAKSRLTTEDIAVATSKNWTIA